MVCVCPDAPATRPAAIRSVRPDTTYSLAVIDPVSGTRLVCIYRPDGHYSCHPLRPKR